MSSARRVLLLAAFLLLAAEIVSLSLLLRSVGDRQSERARIGLAQAGVLLPRIVDWMKQRGSTTSTSESWIEPFDEVALDSRAPIDIAPEIRRKIEQGELAIELRPDDRSLYILGQADTSRGAERFQLTSRANDTGGSSPAGVLIAQHLLILVASLLALILAAVAREASSTVGAVTAYEEAMSRLRQRDHDRIAAFETERASLTATLRDREAMARAGELTAGIVHEVGNSIGAIAVEARVAEQSGDPRVHAAGASIVEEVRTIQTVMTRFVNFIRTEEVRWDKFDLDRMVRRVAAREQAHLHSPVQVLGESTMVLGDEDLLERAIENVVRNACQAVGAEGRVSVALGIDAGDAFVRVLDNGPGIADPDKALRPFESNRPGGLGLGLPLVLKILSLHQGTLDLSSNPSGPGTCATCHWPQPTENVTFGNQFKRSAP